MKRYTLKRNLEGKYVTLVNLYTDPKMAEFNKYEKKAFVSFVFSSVDDPTQLSENEIYNIMNTSEIRKLSMYTDERYENVKELFPSDIRYPTIIFEKSEDYTACNICVLAIPIKGIVPVIKKSDNYKLYNGSLVICRLFKYQNTTDKRPEFYNKLIYVTVEVTTAFNFVEYRATKDHYYGCMKNYTVALDDGLALSLRQDSFLVPYKEREDFFNPTQRQPNIFKLSDIPDGIFVSHNYIMKEMSGE